MREHRSPRGRHQSRIQARIGSGDDIRVKISTLRHNDDPAFKPLFGTDMITLTLKGSENGDMVDFEGSALQLPGVAFRAVLTLIGD